MPPLMRFPEGWVTPHGAHMILHDRVPQFGLTSYDDTVVFHMLGGLSIPDRQKPGRVEVKGLKGLVPPWRTIDQKGATQDGVSFVEALYDPIEVVLDARAKGKDPADCRRVSGILIASLDAKQESRLFWFTWQLGYWWAPVRWFKTPTTSVGAISTKTQDWDLRLRADTGFWQSFPSVDEFIFSYVTTSDTFDDADDLTGLGSGWTVVYSGSGSGILRRRNGQVDPSLTGGRRAIARRNGYTSGSNNQVIEVQLGSLGQWWGMAPGTYMTIWGRMNTSGTPGTDGIRFSFTRHQWWLSVFVAGVETVLRHGLIIIPPLPWERWRLVVGQEGAERTYQIMRGSATIHTVVEVGTASLADASHRGVGFEIQNTNSGGVLAPAIMSTSAGDNTTVSQSGFLRRVNAGDQPMCDNYIVYGPGTFRFWNGPNAGPEEYVEFGPVLENQIMYLRTDPRKRGVVDMTVIPPSPQALDFFQQALKGLLSFFTGGRNPFSDSLLSIFGVQVPQGNPYSLLKGRWSDAAAIPPKSPGKPAEAYHVKVSIDDGNANSKVLVTGTPLRRLPF